MSSELERRLQRLSNLLVHEAERWERSTRARRARVMEDIAQSVERHVRAVLEEKDFRRQERREVRRERRMQQREDADWRRRQRRADKRERERENASVLVGTVMLAVALAIATFGFLHPEMWWLVFAALGIGSGGARNIAFAVERGRAPRTGAERLAPPAPVPGKPHEVDALCDGLLAELKQSPEAVREFLQNPEATVESLRATCKALDARRQQLLAQDPGAQQTALARQRDALTAKRDATTDTTARRKLDEALVSLAQQSAALGQLTALSERVDGEYTSLVVLLQEMRTRVTVAKSAGSGAPLEALRLNVQRLNTELEAITFALEEVQTRDLPPVSPLPEAEDSGTVGGRSRTRG